MDRAPVVAGAFYPADADACRRDIERVLRAASPPALERLVAGIVPHAGWAYSGSTAAYLYAALRAQGAPETVVLFGAVHAWGVQSPSVYARGGWLTPLGRLEVDEALATEALAESDLPLVDDPRAHDDEHALEVQLPFIKHLFPDARILPIAVPPSAEATAVGEGIGRLVQRLGRRAVALGSTDLTHYGPRYGLAPAGVGAPALEWARDNDRRILRLIEALESDAVLDEARTHHNACGAGAVAATIGYARTMGAQQGTLLRYTTSHDVMPHGQPSDLVGYAAIAFV